MLHSLFRAGLAMGLFGLLLVPGTAWAQKDPVRHVQDNAGIFKQDAIDEANAVISKIHDKHHKSLFIETVKEGPEKAAQAKWSKDRLNEHKIDGVYVVFCKQPKFFRIEVSAKTRAEGYFEPENVRELEKIITSKQSADEMLKRIADYTLETMNQHVPKKKADVPVVVPKAEVPVAPKADVPVRPQPAPVVRHDPVDAGIPPWVGWVCIGVAVLAGIWIIFAIIRAITGMMGGGGGGYGYGGGGMMGGGGGLFTGMLGGLFGAMAGMWIYNNMFGGHAAYGQNGNVDWGGGNQGAGASGGGDDWGGGNKGDGADAGGGKGDDGADGGGKGGDDDAGGGGGGGDWGGGGGDAGGGDAGGGDAGGGDAGGGGDWGGGGGDAGGGDAGGGGGGDFGGGGGGDFGGGGGGGGDW